MESYDLNDLNRYWMRCLNKEARRIEPQPLLIKECVDVLEQHPEVLVGIGGGDRFEQKLGHIEEYRKFNSKPTRIGEYYTR